MSSQEDMNEIYLAPNGDSRNSEGVLCASGVAGCSLVFYDLSVPNYWKHGASVQWLWRNIGQVTVGVNNIFDKTYVARCSGPAGCTYGAGRQIIGTVTKRF